MSARLSSRDRHNLETCEWNVGNKLVFWCKLFVCASISPFVLFEVSVFRWCFCFFFWVENKQKSYAAMRKKAKKTVVVIFLDYFNLCHFFSLRSNAITAFFINSSEWWFECTIVVYVYTANHHHVIWHFSYHPIYTLYPSVHTAYTTEKKNLLKIRVDQFVVAVCSGFCTASEWEKTTPK